MTFPTASNFNLVVAATNADGVVDFIDADAPATMYVPGAIDGAFYWAVEDGHSIDKFGRAADKMAVAGPNGSTFGVMCFPANSAGKLDLHDSDSGAEVHGDDAAMHATDTIDYEIILSGQVDIELPGGKMRTLKPGDLLVMAGVPHAWKNRYDEDCLYIAVTIGFNK